eukprot:s619_g37.t1
MAGSELVLRLKYSKTFIDASVEEVDAQLSPTGDASRRSCSAPPGRAEELFLVSEEEYLNNLTEMLKDTSPTSMQSTDISPCLALSELSRAGLEASPVSAAGEEPTAPSPRLSLQLLPSPGTLGHPEVCRRPCMHFQLGHCMNGSACNFCHAAHPEKAAKLDKKQRMLLQTLSNQEFSAMILQYIQQRLAPASEAAKVAADDLIECLREKAGEASLPTLLEREQKNLQKTFARMNVSNLIGVLTHKFSKSDEDGNLSRGTAGHGGTVPG